MPMPSLAVAPTMLATRVPCQELSATPQPPKIAGGVLGDRDPVAGVGGVAVFAVAVVGRLEAAVGVGGHGIDARQHSRAQAGKVEMAAKHAAVEHRDDDRGAAGDAVPGSRGIDRRADLGVRRAQVPLARLRAQRPRAADGRAEQRVVGHQAGPPPLVDHRPLNVGVLGQAGGQRRRVDPLRVHDLPAVGDLAPTAQGDAGARRQGVGSALQRRLWRAAGGRQFAQRRGAGLEGHDDPAVRGQHVGGRPEGGQQRTQGDQAKKRRGHHGVGAADPGRAIVAEGRAGG